MLTKLIIPVTLYGEINIFPGMMSILLRTQLFSCQCSPLLCLAVRPTDIVTLATSLAIIVGLLACIPITFVEVFDNGGGIDGNSGGKKEKS